MNTTNYDYIVIGGGPAGLACAQLLSRSDVKVLLLEKESSLGGCHRVIRREGYFTEHGPRIYTGAYVNFIKLLEDVNLNFYELFTEYEYNILNLSRIFLKEFTLAENGTLTWEFIKFMFDSGYGENTSLSVATADFTDNGKSLIDRICRTIDGGTIETYSINKFLHGIDDNVFYRFYQPQRPNDKGLFAKWSDRLRERNVDIRLNTDVTSINPAGQVSTLNGESFSGKNIIIATPPRHMYNLLVNSRLQNVFVDDARMVKWVEDTDYIRYITLTFHWNKHIDVAHKNRIGDTDWAISDIKLSHYMKDINVTRATPVTTATASDEFVISAAVVYLDRKSKFTGKTADESSYDELIQETFRQLQSMSETPIPMYDRAFVNPKVKKIDGKWTDSDTAFVNTYNNTFRTFPFRSEKYPNIFNVGTHNNVVHYHYTSLETAVTNAIMLVNGIIETTDTTDTSPFPILSTTKLTTVLKYTIVVAIVIILIIIARKWRKRA